MAEFSRPTAARKAARYRNDPRLRLVILLACAWLFGGGGVGAALPNLVVQLLALAILAVSLPAVVDFWRTVPPGLRVLVGVTLALPLIQLVPLPPAVWLVLPGHEAVAESGALVEAPIGWRAWSIDPHRTFLAAAGLVSPFTVLALAWQARDRDDRPLLALLVVLGLAAVALGAVQMAAGNDGWLVPAAARGSSDLQATFANRNSSGLFFALSLTCLVCLPATGRPVLDHPIVRSAVGVILMIAVVAAHSRSAMALALVPLSIAIWRAMRSPALRSQRNTGIVVAAIVVAVGGLVTIAATGNNRLSEAVERFERFDDARLYIWPDALTTAARFWPAGGGMGTFDDAFQLDESLETLQPLRAGRVHNDYLEVAYEAGLAGALLALGWLLWLVGVSVRSAGKGRSIATFAPPLVLWLIAAQSLNDYPLRNQCLLCIAACMIGLAAANAQRSGGRSRRGGIARSVGGVDFRKTGLDQ